MDQSSNYLVIAESLEGNIIRLHAISELIERMERFGQSLPKGTSILIDDVSDSLDETLSYLFKAAVEDNVDDPDRNIGKNFNLPDLPGH